MPRRWRPACDNCKGMRRKCSHDLPCDRCTLFGLTCEFDLRAYDCLKCEKDGSACNRVHPACSVCVDAGVKCDYGDGGANGKGVSPGAEAKTPKATAATGTGATATRAIPSSVPLSPPAPAATPPQHAHTVNPAPPFSPDRTVDDYTSGMFLRQLEFEPESPFACRLVPQLLISEGHAGGVLPIDQGNEAEEGEDDECEVDEEDEKDMDGEEGEEEAQDEDEQAEEDEEMEVDEKVKEAEEAEEEDNAKQDAASKELAKSKQDPKSQKIVKPKSKANPYLKSMKTTSKYGPRTTAILAAHRSLKNAAAEGVLTTTKSPFARLVRHIAAQHGKHGKNDKHRFTAKALLALQEVSEVFLTRCFYRATLMALHADRRSVMKSDLVLGTFVCELELGIPKSSSNGTQPSIGASASNGTVPNDHSPLNHTAPNDEGPSSNDTAPSNDTVFASVHQP